MRPEALTMGYKCRDLVPPDSLNTKSGYCVHVGDCTPLSEEHGLEQERDGHASH
jgi:hypothetical protein